MEPSSDSAHGCKRKSPNKKAAKAKTPSAGSSASASSKKNVPTQKREKHSPARPAPQPVVLPPAHLKFFDIAVNLTDSVFHGVHRNKQVHEDDFHLVLERARQYGVKHILVSGTSLESSRQAVELCKQYPDMLRCTVGCHPAESSAFDNSPPLTADQYLSELHNLVRQNPDCVAAFGEIGLDYAELKYCPKDVQHKYFEQQLVLAEHTKLPLFLHSRDCGHDFVEVVKKHRHRFSTGVVHSFTGSPEELQDLLSLGLYVGVNGTSFRSEDRCDVVKHIPLDRLMLETDAPWCDIQPSFCSYPLVQTHFPPAYKKEKFVMGSMVQRRNEPATIIQVCEVMAAICGKTVDEVAEHAYRNAKDMFWSE